VPLRRQIGTQIQWNVKNTKGFRGFWIDGLSSLGLRVVQEGFLPNGFETLTEECEQIFCVVRRGDARALASRHSSPSFLFHPFTCKTERLSLKDSFIMRATSTFLSLILAGCATGKRHDSTQTSAMFDDHGRTLGCSWYCGAPPISVTASSSLRDGINSYEPGNIHDTKKSTVWAEGEPGQGIGTRITFTFDCSAESYRDMPQPDGIDRFSLINGFARTRELWTANSRVKTLRLSFNGRAVGSYEIADTDAPQRITLPKLTFQPRRKNRLVVQIADVYPGTTYDDTCIADIVFDGFGVRH